MPTYDWTQFVKRIIVNVPVKEVYLTWTLGDELERWFLKEAKFVNAYGNHRDADSPIQVGDTYTWRWYGWDGQDQGEILEANGKDRLVFTFAGPCKVTVTFKQQGSGTLVELVQENIPTDDESKAKLHVSCIQGWTFYMANLKSMLEGGIDLRNKEEAIVADAVNV
jgi:uncharacterized protein YndB with AHSA1/START domain